jgi:hypothetical protein
MAPHNGCCGDTNSPGVGYLVGESVNKNGAGSSKNQKLKPEAAPAADTRSVDSGDSAHAQPPPQRSNSGQGEAGIEGNSGGNVVGNDNSSGNGAENDNSSGNEARNDSSSGNEAGNGNSSGNEVGKLNDRSRLRSEDNASRSHEANSSSSNTAVTNQTKSEVADKDDVEDADTEKVESDDVALGRANGASVIQTYLSV